MYIKVFLRLDIESLNITRIFLDNYYSRNLVVEGVEAYIQDSTPIPYNPLNLQNYSRTFLKYPKTPYPN